MKKLLIFVLIVATLFMVGIVPMASASTDGNVEVEYKGDSIVSDKIETDEDWASAFSIFSEMIDVYYGVSKAELNVHVSFNVNGVVAEGSYDRGVFHDVWPDSALGGDYLYNDIYFADLKGYQYGPKGEIKEINFESGNARPLIIDIINDLKLNDIEETWSRASYGDYNLVSRGYVKNNAPTIRFKDGKLVNLSLRVISGDVISRWEINFDYGTAIVPLPGALKELRDTGKASSSIDGLFDGLDRGVATFMGKIGRSFLGGVATFLANAVSLITEKGLIFFIIAFVLMCYARTRKAGVLMFVSVAVGAVFTNFVLKDLIMRTRPYETDTLYYGFWKAIGAPIESGYSFPSGHTTAVMAAATAFCISFKKKYRWLGFLAVLAVGISRIYLMAHYTSDVIVAVLVGGLASLLAVYITKLIYYVVEHYRGNEICDAILTRDVKDIFKKKKVETQDENTEAQPNDVTEEIKEETVTTEAKPDTTTWEETLVALMTEVRDLLKSNNADKSKASETLDLVENAVKSEGEAK